MIHCDECKRAFKPSKLMNEPIYKDIERHYIRCPWCGTEYTSYFSDKQVRSCQEEVQSLASKKKLTTSQNNKLSKLQRKAKKRMDELEDEF